MKKKKNKHKIEKMHKKNILIIAIAVVILIGFAIWWYLQMQTQSNMVTHTDAKNQFSISVPSDWQTQENVAVQTTGMRTAHPITQSIDVTQLYVDQGAGVTIQVYEGASICPLPEKPTTTLATLPAVYNQPRNEWTIFTTTSKIVVRAYYPGIGVFHRSSFITPSPVSQSDIEAYKTKLTAMLATLHFNNVQSLICN